MARFAQRERIRDGSLFEAIQRAERGLLDADLGAGIVKQRVARPGQGRSGGYRMLMAYRSGDRAVFLYGFAKSERENISDNELPTLREIGPAIGSANESGSGFRQTLAKSAVAADAQQLARAIEDGALQEVTDDEDDAADPADEGPA